MTKEELEVLIRIYIYLHNIIDPELTEDFLFKSDLDTLRLMIDFELDKKDDKESTND